MTLSPIRGGDRCVIVLLTPHPWRRTRYLRAWAGAGTEYVICTTPSGSGGIMSVTQDPVGHGDLLLMLTDMAGMEAVVEYDYANPGLPDGPFAIVEPRSGWTPEIIDRRHRARLGWEALAWPRLHSHIDPTPASLVPWAVGWWDGWGQEGVVPVEMG